MTPERWRRVEEIFQAALEQPSGSRDGFVAVACADDELRHEVESLLRRRDDSAAAAPAWPVSESLPNGARLGPYEILGRIGAGGMGTVHRARDTRVDRIVAVKICREHLSGRFEQEARAIAALNHPHICTLHDLGHQDGVDYLVMEYVEGETLAERLAKGRLPVAQAVRYAIEIANALSAAHARGIIHRDLKPGNIMVTQGGVKVLDFGLAKLSRTEDQGGAQSETVTASRAIIGTPAYMSPEQAEGTKVDARSDIFSFGLVLYEMLSGKRAFSGLTPMANMAAILNQEPAPLGEAVPGLPKELERILMRCLRKDLARRSQSMAEIKIALEEFLEDSQSGSLPAPAIAIKSVPKRRWRLAAVAMLAVCVLAAVWWLTRGEQVASFEPVPLTSFVGSENSPSFSPDGSQVAFSWDGERQQQFDIYVKLIGGGYPLRLTTDPGQHSGPVWSPDGKSIAYFGRHADGRKGIFLIPALGGPERLLMESATGLQLAWSPDGKWIAASPAANDATSDLNVRMISLDTGELRDLAKLNPALTLSRQPAFSPDSRWLAYTTYHAGNFGFAIWTIELTPDLKPLGRPTQITFGKLGVGYPVWTPDSREIIFQEGSPEGNGGGICRVKPDGKGKVHRIPGLSSANSANSRIAIARNGRMAFARGGFDSDIWRYDLKGADGARKWIASTAREVDGAYSPDGERIAFASHRSGTREIWVCDADGGNEVPITHFGGPVPGTARWSPEGRQIAFDVRIDGNVDIFVIGSEGVGQRRLTETPGESARPEWSHDGQFIYFSSNRSGMFQIWRMPAVGGAAVQVTKNGGFAVRVSLDDQWLFYSKGGGPIWRMRPDGTDDSIVFPPDTASLSYAVMANALYGVTRTGPPGSGVFTVQSLRFSDGKISELLHLEFNPFWGLSLTPDERYLLLTKPDEKGTDLMLVEGFR